MRNVVWFLVVVLAIVHFDFWFWDDKTLLFGFLPIGLAFHASFSIACGLVWFLAVNFAWPKEIEEWADENEPPPSPATGMPLQRAAGMATDPFAGEEDSL